MKKILVQIYRFFRGWRWWSIRWKAWRQNATLKIGVGSYILSPTVSVSIAPGATLMIGDDVCLRRNTSIQVLERVEIGSETLIAEMVTVRDHDHVISTNRTVSHRKAGWVSSPIKIGSNVWIGNKVTVTCGVTIGSNSVIGANSVVMKDVPEDVVAAGIPAGVLKSVYPTEVS